MARPIQMWAPDNLLGVCPSNPKIADLAGAKTIPEPPFVGPGAFYKVEFCRLTLLGQAPSVKGCQAQKQSAGSQGDSRDPSPEKKAIGKIVKFDLVIARVDRDRNQA